MLREGGRRRLGVAALWVVGGSVGYALLRTNQYSGEGIRWFSSIVYSPHPVAGGANHLLYPALQWGWFHALRALGLAGHGIEGVVGRLQLLNAVCGGLGLGLMFLLLEAATGDLLAACLGTAILAACFAYSSLATDMPETMPSFVPVAGAFLLAIRSWSTRGVLAAAVVAGVAVAVATSVYESAILCAPALLLAFYLRPWAAAAAGARTEAGATTWRAALGRPAPWVFGASLVLSTAAIFYLAIRALVGPGLQAIIKYATGTPGEGVFGGFSLLHYAGLLLGWANATVGLLDYTGGSRLLRHGLTPSTLFNLAAIAFTLAAAVAVAVVARATLRAGRPARPAALVLFAWFAIPVVFAGYWANTYNKLWLAPMAGWAGLLAVLYAAGRREGAPTRLGLAFRAGLVAYLALIVFADGGAHLLPGRLAPNHALLETRALARQVGPHDLVVLDGWDTVGVAVTDFTALPQVSMVDTGFRKHFDPSAVRLALARRVCAAQADGGRVFAVELLQVSREAWVDGDPTGIHRLFPYDLLDGLRAVATPAAIPGLAPADAAEPVAVIGSLAAAGQCPAG